MWLGPGLRRNPRVRNRLTWSPPGAISRPFDVLTGANLARRSWRRPRANCCAFCRTSGRAPGLRRRRSPLCVAESPRSGLHYQPVSRQRRTGKRLWASSASVLSISGEAPKPGIASPLPALFTLTNSSCFWRSPRLSRRFLQLGAGLVGKGTASYRSLLLFQLSARFL